MAEDILISVGTELDKALKDLQNLEKQIKSTQASVNNELNPAVNNTSTKITSMGNKVSAAGTKIKNAISGETALAFTALGAGVTAFAKQCVDSAIQSETAWTRFGAMVNSNGGNWNDLKGDVKDWAKTVSEETSRSVGSIRNAGMAFLEMGLNVEQMKKATEASMGVAARAGITETEAADVVRSALLGKGRQLEKLTGLRIDDYKNAEGQIDQERLLNDIYNQNKGAIEDYANSTEGQMNKIQNSLAKLKTGIGQALLPVVTVVAGVVGKVVTWFDSLGDAPKTVVAGFVAFVAVITTLIGVLGLIAGPLINLGTLISKAGEAIGKLELKSGISNSWKTFKDKISSVKDAIGKLNIGDKVKSIKSAVLNSWTTLKNKINSAKTAITQYDIKQKLVNAGNGIKGAVLSAWTTLTTKINNAKNALQAFELRQKLATIAQKAHTVATTIWSGVTKVATLVQGALNAVLAMNPIFLVIIAITALIAVLGYLYFNNEQVRNTLNALGDYIKGGLITAWNSLMNAVNIVSQALQGAWNYITQLWNSLSTLGSGIVTTLMNAFSSIGTVITTTLMMLWTQAGMLIGMIVNGIVMRFNMLIMNVRLIFQNIVIAIYTRLMTAVIQAGLLATRIRTVIQQRLQAIVNKVRAIFQSIVNQIRSRLVSAASTARQKAVEIYNNIVNKIRELPSKVGSEISSLAGKIKDGLVQAGVRAFEGAKHLVAQFLAGMGIHSPGVIQRSTKAEFESLPSIINNQGLEAGKQAYNSATNIIRNWNEAMGDGLTIPQSSIEDLQLSEVASAINPFVEREIKTNITADKINTAINPELFKTDLNPNLLSVLHPSENNRERINNNNTSNTQKTLIIKEVNLDCHDLTKAESKKMLWNAIEGAYEGL